MLQLDCCIQYSHNYYHWAWRDRCTLKVVSYKIRADIGKIYRNLNTIYFYKIYSLFSRKYFIESLLHIAQTFVCVINTKSFQIKYNQNKLKYIKLRDLDLDSYMDFSLLVGNIQYPFIERLQYILFCLSSLYLNFKYQHFNKLSLYEILIIAFQNPIKFSNIILTKILINILQACMVFFVQINLHWQ